MLDCLYNLVGLKGCLTSEPDSRLYVNSLPGLDLKQFQQVANQEQQNYLGVWADVQERAAIKLQADFTRWVNKYYSINCCNDGCDVDQILCDYRLQLAPAYQYLLGAEFMVERAYSDRINYSTTIARDDALELRDLFNVEYENALKTAVRSLPRDLIAGCLECTGGAVYRVKDLP